MTKVIKNVKLDDTKYNYYKQILHSLEIEHYKSIFELDKEAKNKLNKIKDQALDIYISNMDEFNRLGELLLNHINKIIE